MILLLDNTLPIADAIGSPVDILGDVLSCEVSETLNGAYTAVLKIPATSPHYADLQGGALFKCKANRRDGEQVFRITNEVGEPLGGVATFNANHISYDLSKTSVIPFEVTGAAAAVAALNNPDYKTGGASFTVSTDSTNVSSKFKNEILQSARAMFAGQAGSLLDVFGGEWKFDNLNCQLLRRRGADHGFIVMYGKNLTDYRMERNLSDMVTAVRAYAKPEGQSAVLSGLIEIVQSAEPKIKNVDFTDRFEPGETPTTPALNSLLNSYIQNNNLTQPKISIKVSFINLAETEEYKNLLLLEDCGMGDSVQVLFDKYPGLSATAKIVEYRFDALREKYISVEIGEARVTLADKITQVTQEIKRAQTANVSFFESAISKATDLITGGLGGYVVINQDASGHPEEILIMDSPDKATAVNVIRMNRNGIGFSQTGYNGAFRSAWTIDNTFNAENINVINLNAASIVAGILTDALGLNYWNLETGAFSLQAGTQIGGQTVSQIANGAVSNAMTQQNVFDTLTNNGATQGIYLQNGQLYINAEYIMSGILRGMSLRFGAEPNLYEITQGVGSVEESGKGHAHTITSFINGVAVQPVSGQNESIFGVKSAYNIKSTQSPAELGTSGNHSLRLDFGTTEPESVGGEVVTWDSRTIENIGAADGSSSDANGLRLQNKNVTAGTMKTAEIMLTDTGKVLLTADNGVQIEHIRFTWNASNATVDIYVYDTLFARIASNA